MANVIPPRTAAKEASLTADCPEDYPYEAKRELRDPAVREGYWRVAMGLQEVDGLKPSPYLRDLAREHVSGVRGLDETGSMIRAYHARRKADGRDEAAGEREADLVSQRIVELLASGAFALVPDMLAVIHGALFQDLDAATYRPGEYKTEALQKREFVLNGDSVVYADPSLIERSLAFLFDEERSHVYGIEFDEAHSNISAALSQGCGRFILSSRAIRGRRRCSRCSTCTIWALMWTTSRSGGMLGTFAMRSCARTTATRKRASCPTFGPSCGSSTTC